MVSAALLGVVVQVLGGSLALVALASLALVGPERLLGLRRTLPAKLRSVWPYLAALVAVLVLNSLVRDLVPEVSWAIGLNVTGYIYALENGTVAWIQSFATPPLTVFFSGAYVFGYVFVLTFPLVAYLALPDDRPLKLLVTAYACNYGIGLVLYALVVAYGPRNIVPGQVESLLYTTYPQYQILTSAVNTNTNVFPSLHASLSATVALVARRTADAYRGWYVLSIALAASIALATMYLGIHWATDVVAGVALAVGCVAAADRLVDLAERRGDGRERPL